MATDILYIFIYFAKVLTRSQVARLARSTREVALIICRSNAPHDTTRQGRRGDTGNVMGSPQLPRIVAQHTVNVVQLFKLNGRQLGEAASQQNSSTSRSPRIRQMRQTAEAINGVNVANWALTTENETTH